jgi:hypothetical protein
VGERRTLGMVLMRLAGVECALGNAKSALERAEEAVHINETIGDEWSRAFSLSVLAAARKASGDEDGALAVCTEVLEIERSGNPDLHERAQLRLALTRGGDAVNTWIAQWTGRTDVDKPHYALTRRLLLCLQAQQEQDEAKAKALAQQALGSPMDWQEFLDVALATARKLGVLQAARQAAL